MHPRQRRRAIAAHLLVGASLLACGCGTHAGSSSTLPRTRLRELPAPTPTADRYGTDATAHAAGAEGEIAQAVIEAGTGLQLSVVTDGRLGQLAAWAAQHSIEGTLPPHGAIDEASHRLGIVEPTPALVVYRTNDAAALAPHVRTDIVGLLGKRRATHVGVGLYDADGSTTAVVVLSERKLSMESMPRLPGTLASVELRGQLTAGFLKPELVVMRPDGEIERSSLGAGPAFGARARLGPPGVYRIELLARGTHGVTVVANFPLRAGVPEPATIRTQEPVGGDDGDVAGALLALINRDRGATGLGPLARRGDLDAIALSHSRDMDEGGFIGHTSPTTGTVADRVRAAGLETPLALENIGRDYSASAIHAALMASPGHRANIVNPRATHVGIDLVRQTEGTPGEEGTRDALLVTQVFILVVADIDPERAADDAMAALSKIRAERGLSALSRDDKLDELARGGATHYFDGGAPSQAEAMAHVNAAMHKTSLPYSQVQALALVGSSVDLAGVDALLDPKARAIGVGFAQGERGDAQVNPVTIAVVLLGY